jgi:hypothetical protein
MDDDSHRVVRCLNLVLRDPGVQSASRSTARRWGGWRRSLCRTRWQVLRFRSGALAALGSEKARQNRRSALRRRGKPYDSGMVGSAEHRVARLADYLTLVYHEARNVRHLVSKGAVEPERWRFLVALPTNRDAAWREMQELRRQASVAETASESAKVFAKRFRLSLEDLKQLYGNDAWRSYAAEYGGTPWRVIVDHVIELRRAIARGDHTQADDLLARIPKLGHNTVSIDGVARKLRMLDASTR